MRKPANITALACLLLSCGMAPLAEPRQESDLVVRLAPGAGIDYAFTYDLRSNTRWGKMDMPASIHYEQALTLRRAADQPREVEGTDYELTFGRITGHIESPLAKPMDFDSDEDRSKYPKFVAMVLRPVLQPVGHSVRITLSEKARVLDLQGWEAIFAEDGAKDPVIDTSLPMTDSWFRDHAQLLFAILPEGPVSEGSRWEPELSVPHGAHSVTFRPRTVVRARGDGRTSWAFATAMDEVRDPGELVEAGAGQAWFTDATSVSDASLMGATTVSDTDGLALTHDVELTLVVSVKNPLGGEPIKTDATERLALRRKSR